MERKKAEFINRKIKKGEMTINQARMEYGLPPIDGGEIKCMKLDWNAFKEIAEQEYNILKEQSSTYGELRRRVIICCENIKWDNPKFGECYEKAMFEFLQKDINGSPVVR